MLKKSAGSGGDISARGTAVVVACATSECEAIQNQCITGPESKSLIFEAGVVSPEAVPSGLFVRALADVIQSYRDTHGQEHDLAIPNCIQALSAVKDLVLETILLQCPDPRDGAFVDPRPTLTEAWLQAMIALVDARSLDPAVESLMAETCVAIVSLIFYPTMGKTQNERMNDPGMTLDGPHSLAVTTFLGAFFRQVPTRILQAAGQRLLCIIPVDIASMQGLCQDQNFQGVAVVGAALFRACQGALPPWAVESIPDVYSSLFEAFGKDVEAFGLLMRLSMEVRLSKTSDLRSGFGGMVGGNLLSGRFFETMSDKAKETFIEETKQLCKENKATSWRRLKVSIKQNCGGKKRDTDFNQKPSQTRWEFDRI